MPRFKAICEICTIPLTPEERWSMIIGPQYEVLCQDCYNWIRAKRKEVKANATVGV